MKMLLVSANRRRDDFETFGSETRLDRMPKLGPLYLAASIREALGEGVELEYMDLSRVSLEALGEGVARLRPDVVGLSSLSVDAEVLHAAAAVVARAHPCTIVAGGPYPTSAPEELAFPPGPGYPQALS